MQGKTLKNEVKITIMSGGYETVSGENHYDVFSLARESARRPFPKKRREG